MNLDALRALGAAQAAPVAREVEDWADSLRETFDSRYAAQNALTEDIRAGRRDAYGRTAKSIIRNTKHVGTRAAFQCPTCRAIGTRVGQCDGCRRSYAA